MIDDTLRAWVESAADGRVVSAKRPAGGGSRELYLVDIERPDGSVVPLVLRCEAGGSFTGTDVSPAKEAVVYRALAGTRVPVPAVLGMAPDDAALLMERVAGTDDISGLGTDAQEAVMSDFVDALSALHNIDVASLDLPGFPRPQNAEDHARLDLAQWARFGNDHVTSLDPLVRFSGAWLRAHAPGNVERTVLVQGDTGPGNFLHDGANVTALIDWEFAHLGDPMDDWAWIAMRMSGRDLAPLHARYTAATGIPIDLERVQYYGAAVSYRCAITTSMAVSRGGGARGFAPYLLVTQRYIAELASRMSELLGITEDAEVITTNPTPRTAYYDEILDGLRSAVRSLQDSEQRDATRNLQILVHHLRAYDEIGDRLETADREDRRHSLGAAALDEQSFCALVEDAGDTGAETTFRYLLRRAARMRVLWASLLDRRPR